MARVLTADGNDVFRRLLKLLIESHPGWTVCGEATDGQQAVDMARDLKPDVVILDLAMPGLNGLLAAREICRILPTVPVLLNTINNIPAVIAEAGKYGIRRVIGKNEDGNRLLSVIQEELDARPKGLPATLDEITPPSGSMEGRIGPLDRKKGPPKAN